MNSIVGFSLFYKLPAQKTETALTAQETALSYFKHLQHHSITIGESRLELWGHNNINDRIHYLPDGTLLALIGSELGEVSLMSVGDRILNIKNIEDFVLPWDGRVILLRVSADGKQWTMWNDWLGSIPVFHAAIGQGRVASTLESVTVATAGYTPNNFYLPGLVSLLINGHFLSDWTLFSGMKTIPPDCVSEWTDASFHSKQLRTIEPSQDRWDVGWDDLVDEMHELSRKAIADVLKAQSTWILPLSAGLDSRLIAAVGADLGVDLRAYSWGEPNSTDVVYSRRVAKALGYPWKRIDLNKDFLATYTPQWADLFGSSMHFHGMYQMCFLDALRSESDASLITGYVGDVLSGSSLMRYDMGSVIYKKKWYMHWDVAEARALLKVPIDDALQEIADEVKKQTDALSGSRFQKSLFFELWSRQRFFTSFQSTLSSYWRGITTPFINRAYARFCMSLPRAVHENRRLLADVFRRYYGRLAVIPGTYGNEPFILTGSYLAQRRIAKRLPNALQFGFLNGFDTVELRMDMLSVQASGQGALWPIYNTWDQLREWLDVNQLDLAYQSVINNAEDIRPLRRLQSVQTLAYRLMN